MKLIMKQYKKLNKNYPRLSRLNDFYCYRDILDKNGTAVDAAIATMFCNGVVTMQSMGLGGGFLMTIYKKDEGKAYFLNAREKAPLAAKSELYKANELISRNGR